MKTQMRFQKILMLVTLIVAALSIVYALSFCGGTVYQYGALYDKVTDSESVPGVRDLYLSSQSYNDTLLALTIVFVIIVVLNYIMATQKRRNYYITNYISIILTAVYAVVLAVLLLVFVSDTMSLFTAVDKDIAKSVYSSVYGDFKYSTINFVMGYLLAAVIVIDAVFLVLNLVWKIKLMQGEKKLLQAAEATPAQTEEVA